MVATQPASGTRGFPIYGLRACLFVSAALVVAFTHSNTVTLSRVLPASLLGFFLLVSAVKDPVVGALLSWRPLAWVGGFSFSVYLTHEVVINLCSAVAQRFSLVLWEQFLVYFGVVPLVMLPVAYGFHLVLERPFQRKKAAIRPGPTVVAPGV
jgi:peptidoglycan/LPS O-acetylase OafA/YrhL